MSTEVAMSESGTLLARDFASMLLDVVPDAPCDDASVACSLRTLVDYMVPLTLGLAVCVAIGFVFAISLSIVNARYENARPPRRRRRVLSGPVRSDGRWLRLVEDEHGRRVVEVLEGAAWKPAGEDRSTFPIEMPAAPRPGA
jgi:hypothetical protein